MKAPDLRVYGACVGADPALFFPGTEQDAQRACEICERCPVRAACLEQALARQERYGIWGGTTPDERRRMHRRLKLPTAAKQRRDEKREAARRMYAQGRARTDIARFLHVSGATVNSYLAGRAQQAA